MQLIRPFSLASFLAAAVALGTALPAGAALVVDTGSPSGVAVGAYALDGGNFIAGQVSFAQAVDIRSITTHLLGATAGETFTLTLYADNAAHLPASALYSAHATLAGDGWNGLSGLSGWTLAAGTYWIAAELGPQDTGGSGSITGLLLDRGAPAPLARTAFNAGAGWVASAAPLSFGLRVDAVSVVPEPSQWLLLLAGLGAVAVVRRQVR